MKFLIDAQLPRRLANVFKEAGYEAIHTLDLPLPYEAILYHIESRHQPVSSFIEGLKRRGVSDEIIQEALNEVARG